MYGLIEHCSILVCQIAANLGKKMIQMALLPWCNRRPHREGYLLRLVKSFLSLSHRTCVFWVLMKMDSGNPGPF